MFTKDGYTEKLTAALDGMADALEGIEKDDYSTYRKFMAPGTTLGPMDGTLRTKHGKGRAQEELCGALARIDSERDAARKEVMDEMAKPPSADAMRYIEALRGRGNVLPEEVAAGMRAYGGNWTAYRELRDMIRAAIDSGEYGTVPDDIPQHELDGALEYIDSEARYARGIARDGVPVPGRVDHGKMRSKLSFSKFLDGIM